MTTRYEEGGEQESKRALRNNSKGREPDQIINNTDKSMTHTKLPKYTTESHQVPHTKLPKKVETDPQSSGREKVKERVATTAEISDDRNTIVGESHVDASTGTVVDLVDRRPAWLSVGSRGGESTSGVANR